MDKTTQDPYSAHVVCHFADRRGTPAYVLPDLGPDLKRIQGATHLRGERIYLYPAFAPFITDVTNDMKVVLPNVVLSPEAQEHLEHTLMKVEKLKNGNSLYRQGFSFVTQPFGHQEDGLRFALTFPRCGIFYDCGLGKTKIGIDYIRHEGLKTLILVPTVGVGTWVHEAAVHSAGELKALAFKGTVKKKLKLVDTLNDYDVVAMSYDTAERYQVEIMDNFDFKAIIADESHYLRGYTSKRTKAAIALASKASRRVLMSGTPTLGDPMHLYGQLKFLGKFIPGADFWRYKRRYCKLGRGKMKHAVFGYKNLELLNKKVNSITLRRTKDECLDLPERTIIDVPFEVRGKQRTAYNDLVSNSVAYLGENSTVDAEHAALVIQKLLQILSGFVIQTFDHLCDHCEFIEVCALERIKPHTPRCRIYPKPNPDRILRFPTNPKLEVFEDLLESILAEETNKCIVWAYFTEELNILEERLRTKKIGYTRVDGSNSQHAQRLATEFNESETKRVYLAQISTGVALTLTSAQYTIYFGMSYSLDAYLQSIDRNYRIGQTSKTVVYRLVCQSSVLEFVAKALANKLDISKALTTRINCALCKESSRCAKDGTIPFHAGCIYQDSVKKVVTKPVKI